jgi:hypothetical protein
MKPSEIALIRLVNQHIAGTEFKTPKEIVAWMGAMQAQDYPMAKWAIGVRLPGSIDQDIESAIDNADIIRTHLLRPTWHFVAAEDIHWLLELTASQIKAAQSARERDLELTEAVFLKSNTILEKALRNAGNLTRKELITELQKAGIATDQNRASHLFARAELEKIMCSGATRNGEITYALLSERVRKTRELTKEEALGELARRYYNSRGPATGQDFRWWSGLSAMDANQALELVKSDFHLVTIEGRTYWLAHDYSIPPASQNPVFLLPTYDEFIISYAARSASIPIELENHMKEISDRGVFRPILVIDGQVAGIWKRTIHKGSVIVEIQPFKQVDPSIMDLIHQAATQFGSFIEKKVEVKQVS